jgi:hypothetical protein
MHECGRMVEVDERMSERKGDNVDTMQTERDRDRWSRNPVTSVMHVDC